MAVSGGKDSCSLLHALTRVMRLKNLHLEVCHVDHGLRPGSDDDARFVESECVALGVGCHVRKLGPRPPGENMEAWARRERYAVFRKVMRENDLHHLLTAHTANDVTETLLMRLIANKELNTIEEYDEERGCLRPLLDITRSQIEAYVREHGLRSVEDPTNEDTSLVRNRIRGKLIPVLESEFDPSIVWSLSERAQAIAEDCEALQYLAERSSAALGEVAFGNAEWLKGCREVLAPLPLGVRWRVAQVLFTPLLGFTIGQGRAKAILGLLCGDVERVDLDSSRSLSVQGGALHLLT